MELCIFVRFTGDIQLVFGNNALNYVIRLAQGQVDYLPRLSDQLLMRIIQYLALDDIARLALVSKQFNQVIELMISPGCLLFLFLSASKKFVNNTLGSHTSKQFMSSVNSSGSNI